MQSYHRKMTAEQKRIEIRTKAFINSLDRSQFNRLVQNACELASEYRSLENWLTQDQINYASRRTITNRLFIMIAFLQYQGQEILTY